MAGEEDGRGQEGVDVVAGGVLEDGGGGTFDADDLDIGETRRGALVRQFVGVMK